MLMSNTPGRRHRGVALLEALVAMLIMTIGVLSLASMQTTINRYSNEAKLRSDATRLAEQKIEQLRSYTGIASTVIGQGVTSATAVNWDSLAGGEETVSSTNATYTRTWTISGAIADPMRTVQVSMAWLNRVGESESLALRSVISQTDPADSGYLAFPLPLNTNLKRPKDRNLDIPVRAVDLGNGQSGLRYGTGGQYLVFSNVSGDVVKICTPPSLNASSTDAQIVAALTSGNAGVSSCTTISGFIVAGFIKRGSSVSDTDWNAVKDSVGVNTALVTRNAAGTDAISCNVQDATNQNTGTLIADWKSYICVIPLSAPSPALTTNGPYNWSGRILISGPSTWRGSAKYFICRFEYTATATFTDPNLRNAQNPNYQNVNKSIDQQNYLLGTSANTTDTSAPSCPSEMTLSGVSAGVLHQDCRAASNGDYATASANTSCPITGAAATYTVAYDGNQNTGGTAPTDTSSPYVAGSTVTVLANPLNLIRSGYTFGGWNTAANGSGTTYAAGNTFTLSSNKVLYALWIAPSSLTYSGNGATSGTAPTDAGSPYDTGSTVTVLGNTGSLSRTGFTFEGWNTAVDGTGVAYLPGNTFNITGSTTLYAKWNSTTPVTVIYAGNGNTGGTAPTDGSSPYTAGATVTVLPAGSLVKANATFLGWNTAANGSGTSFAAGSTFSIANNMTLYAQWLASIELGQPQPGWLSGAPYTLSWPAITGATGYTVKSCSTTNNNSRTNCTPVTVSTQTATTKTVAPANKETLCYSITATGPSPYVDSVVSATRCLYFKNPNNYDSN
jgi:type IV pilus modification protein PilV